MKVLITAFGPYDDWPDNASWLALVELTRDLPSTIQITTRRYPVDFDAVKKLLARDLEGGHDVALHLGQAPGIAEIHLESIGLNIAGRRDQLPEQFEPLVPNGPPAYRSTLPLARWAQLLRGAGIPAAVSHHAGTYLCNAALYLSLHFARQRDFATRSTFLHLPLDPSQTQRLGRDGPTLGASESARAVRLLLDDLERGASA